MKKIARFLSLLLLLSLCESASLITNGDFETTTCPHLLCDVLTSSPPDALPGWTVLLNGVDITNTSYLNAYNGSWSIDLNSFDTGGLAQSFPTLVGERYEVSFAMAGDPSPGEPSPGNTLVVSMNVSVTGQSAQQFQYNSTGESTSDIQWDLHSFTFVATTTTTTLSFISLISGNSGAYIDSVNVSLLESATDSKNGGSRVTLCVSAVWLVIFVLLM